MAEIIVTKASEAELAELGVSSWPIWACEPSRFDWEYDQKETCYLLEGQVTVTADGESVSFGAGDMVVFPQGLACTWDVSAAVKKHYKFG